MRRLAAGCWLSLLALLSAAAAAADLPRLLTDARTRAAHPLPDFSYAGYGFGLGERPQPRGEQINVADFGARGDDEIDDSSAILQALAAAHAIKGPVTLRFPAGRFIVSEILGIERSDFSLVGAGKGHGGTELYFPRPLKMIDRSDRLDALRAYLRAENKYQLEPARNIRELFSEYSWTGGFLWVGAPQPEAASAAEHLAAPRAGSAGERTLRVTPLESARLPAVGERLQIEWFSSEGRESALLRSLYGEMASVAGARHWEDPERAIVVQTTQVLARRGDVLTLADPLLHDVSAAQPARLKPWRGLHELLISDLAFVFPHGDSYGHHLEQGWNAIHLGDVFNGWVESIRIVNADSGVLSYDSACLTLRDIDTEGGRRAHYAVHLGSVHNALVTGLDVRNPVEHSLSFNTQSSRSVFQRATVWQVPVLDQHAGANHQNLFDDIELRIHAQPGEQGPQYPLWNGSGAGYWQPGHGRFNTHWNIRVVVESGAAVGESVLLQGLDEGPDARVVGLSGNREFSLDYRPAPYVEALNLRVEQAPSLYDWQLARRSRERDTP